MSGGASAVAVCGATAASAAASAAATQTLPGGGCVLPQVDVAPQQLPVRHHRSRSLFHQSRQRAPVLG